MKPDVIKWLMEGDPAIRWQVRRDLLDEPEESWRADQVRVASEGWGARLLAERAEDGRWAEGLYSPKWKSTTYTMLLLRRMGLPRGHAEAVASARLLLDREVWIFGRKTRWPETCVAGFSLGLASWYAVEPGYRERLVGHLLAEQMPDGGWNCRRARGATHSSFHTTINVLEGLLEYRSFGGTRREEVEAAEVRAREFFCQHQLYRSHRTGEVVDPRMARLSFPPRWKHDILRTLDYFRGAGAERDERLDDPIAVLRSKRRKDGRWPVQQRHAGKTWFSMEKVGQASRWNTLRALRVLRWWEQG